MWDAGGGKAARTTTRALSRALCACGLVATGWLLSMQALAADCTPVLARLVSLQGTIEVRRAQSTQWSPAAADAALCPGDAVRVGERSRAALRLTNESNLRLDQNSALTLPTPDEGIAFIELLRGALNVFTRTPQPFKVRTPFVNAGVEGTEFAVRVDADSAQVAVLEGKVSAANELGAVELTSGELAIAGRNAAPRRGRIVRPADAVQWALYYPSILGGPAAADATLREADALARRGRIGEAFARLDTVPADARNARHAAYRAELLLVVGSVDEAKAQITRALALDNRSSDARALQAIIAVVQNEIAEALRLAREAVEIDTRSAVARLALSYAEQARFDIAAALASAEQASELAPDNALAWARVAELRMSSGDLDGALAAAQRASTAGAELARAHTVLGFAHLTRIDTAAARQAFGRAIELDQADPLPRLGLGLARIRDGELAAGRAEIEIAASLDPLNSLVRSYLGKAYYEEKRGALAGEQFDLAKALDPKDPTPWFYDAVRKQVENRPVEALRDLEQSIERNDNRAVYRSRFLLDDDRASRGVSMAQIYRDLRFDELAVGEAADSLAIDPGNHSAHRLLSDAYAGMPRQEVARVSALLQSQLLQPLALLPVQPSLPFTDVSTATGPQLSDIAFNEYSLLFERRGVRFSAAAQIGNNGTRGDELVAAMLWDRLSLSVGQFHYETDGYRPNAGVRHDIYDAFVQFAPSPQLSLQAEARKRKTTHGDIALRFAADDFLQVSRVAIDQQTLRLGASYRPSPRLRFLASLMDNDRDELQRHLEPPGIEVGITGTSPGRQSELQLQQSLEIGHLTFGVGSSRVRLDTNLRIVDVEGVLGGPCSPAEPCDSVVVSHVKQHNAYLYADLAARRDLTVTLGLSRDTFNDGKLDLRVWNPKLGINWKPTTAIGVRAAAFKSLKRALIVDQTIEPVQIAGFSQFFDDFNGTKTRTAALAADWRIDQTLQVTMQTAQRQLRLGPSLLGADLSIAPFEEWNERASGAALFWSPNNRTAVALRINRERFSREPLLMDDRPIGVRSTIVPATLRLFLPRNLVAQIGVTHVRQRVERVSTSPKVSGHESFALLDASIGYRLPRQGSLSLGLYNLSRERFSYQDDNFRSSQTRLPRYFPERSVVVTASLMF